MELGPEWERPGPDAAARRHDVWLAAGLVVAAVITWEVTRSTGMLEGARTSWPEQLAWSVAMAVPLAVRRRFPVAVMLACSALFIACGARDAALGIQMSQQVFLFLALFTAAAWGKDRRVTGIALGAVLVIMFGWVALILGVGGAIDAYMPEVAESEGLLSQFTAIAVYQVGVNVLYFGTAWVGGQAAWRSARQQEQLRLQALELAERQQAEARRAVLDERLRIARELHDVAAHHVSVIGVQAAAARRVLGVDGEAAGRALTAVEHSSRAAVGEMRQLLGVLRSDVPEREQVLLGRSPQPGVEDLDALAASAQEGGLEVGVQRVGQPRQLPSSVSLSLYRTAQEALANVRRHSSARMAQLTLRYAEDDAPGQWVELEVVDDGRPRGGTTAGSGLGHLGMRERAALHGAQVDIGRRPFGGYRVRVRYPLSQNVVEPTQEPVASSAAGTS